MPLTLKEQQIVQLETEIDELENLFNTLSYYPEYPGVLVIKKIKCGKKGCRCQNGYLHGPYVYYQYRENNHLHQKYLNRKIVEEISDKVKANKKYRQTKLAIKKLKKQLQDIQGEI